jgi:2-iminobutanoate/2-iminopropanoate deaminase
MGKREIRSEAAAPGGGYSQAVELGGLVFVSGQGPLDPVSGEVLGETIEEQTAHTIENVRLILEAAELGLEDVVKSTVHLADIGLFGGFDGVYRELFPRPYPARTTVASGLLGILVEIDVVAVREDSR